VSATIQNAILALFLFIPLEASAAPRSILVIGDSLSREYQLEFPEFSEARNWVEILAENRATRVTFGAKSGDRYRYNWALPTYSANDYHGRLFDSGIEDILFRSSINPDFNAVDAVVVFLGGNDIDSVYGDIYNGSSAAANSIINRIRNDLADIIDYVRDQDSNVHIVLVNVPHVGATPEVKADHPTDAVKTQRVTNTLLTLNSQLSILAQQRGIAYADIFTLTADLLAPEEYYLGGFRFLNAGTETGDPRYLWLGGSVSQDFHPNTAGQAVVANAIIAALNDRYAYNINPFSHREIVESVLGLDYDEAFVAWASSYPNLTDPDPLADPDHDGNPTLVEFAFDFDPSRSDADPILAIEPVVGGYVLRYRPNPGAVPALTIIPEHSLDGRAWTPIPSSAIAISPDGTHRAALPAGDPVLAHLRVIVTE
jgi:lysophospholipase L1-like esterase